MDEEQDSPTGKAGRKSNPLPPQRREANRLAASRSRARRAERAGILEVMAKGLAEENRELRERVDVLLGMGVRAPMPEPVAQRAMEGDGEGEREGEGKEEENVAGEGMAEDVMAGAQQQEQEQESEQQEHHVLPLPGVEVVEVEQIPATTTPQPAAEDQPLPDPFLNAPSGLPIPPPPITLSSRLTTHYTSLLADLRQTLDDLPEAPAAGDGDGESQQQQQMDEEERMRLAHEHEDPPEASEMDLDAAFSSHPSQSHSHGLAPLPGQNLHLNHHTLSSSLGGPSQDLPTLHALTKQLLLDVRRSRAEVQDKKVELGSLEVGAMKDERRMGVERGLVDVRKRVGLLMSHYNPSYTDPTLPYLSLSASTPHPLFASGNGTVPPLTIPAKFESIPLPIPQKKGRPVKIRPVEEVLEGEGEGGEGEGRGAGGKRKRGGGGGRGRKRKNVDGEDGRSSAKRGRKSEEMGMGMQETGGEYGDIEHHHQTPHEDSHEPHDQPHDPHQAVDSSALDTEGFMANLEMAGMQGIDISSLSGMDQIGQIGQEIDELQQVVHGVQQAAHAHAQAQQGGPDGAGDFEGLYAAQQQSFASASASGSGSGSTAAQAGQASTSTGEPNNQGQGQGGGTTPRGGKSLRKKVESARRYRIPGDPDTIYVEQTVRGEDGAEEVVTSTKKVYTPRPYTGQGKKRGPKAKGQMGQGAGASESGNEVGGSGMGEGGEGDLDAQMGLTGMDGEFDGDGGEGYGFPTGQLESLVAAAEGEPYMDAAAVADE